MSKKAKGYDARAVAFFVAGRITYRELVAILERRVLLVGMYICRANGNFFAWHRLRPNRAAEVLALGGEIA